MQYPTNPVTGQSLAPRTALAPRVCSVAEFATATGTGPNRVRAYVKQGVIRAVRHGRRIVIPLSEIDRFLEAQAGESK